MKTGTSQLRGAGFGCPVEDPRGYVLSGDGRIAFAGIDLFVLALGDQTTYEAQHPNCRWLNADCNNSGTVTFADIDPFVARIGTTCP